MDLLAKLTLTRFHNSTPRTLVPERYAAVTYVNGGDGMMACVNVLQRLGTDWWASVEFRVPQASVGRSRPEWLRCSQHLV